MISAIPGAAMLAVPAGIELAQATTAPAFLHEIKRRRRGGGRSYEQQPRRKSKGPYYVGMLLIIADNEYSYDNGTRPVLLKNGQVVCYSR